jgi:F-type H+-transporting ATPase subunit b
MPLMQIIAAAEGAGGLFDFNATLPLMAIQFILLTVVLTFVFYKPVAKHLEERELYKQYDEQLKTARVNAQSVIADSEKEAKEIVASEISQARNDAAKLIQQTNKELEAQKSLALEKLETQVDELSQLIKEKLLGKQAAL